MSPTQSEIEASLVEVRKAYRLLHEYQRAAMDTMNYIGNRLGVSYSGGYPWFSGASPRAGRGRLDLWAWDWLNMYLYDFDFSVPDSKGERNFSLSVILFSDTGFFRGSTINKTSVSDFAPPENCETRVVFLFYREWQDEFDRSLESKESLVAMINSPSELPDLLRKNQLAAVSISFSELSDQAGVDRVISKVREFGAGNGFVFPTNFESENRET